jgi:hypothetical protein
MGSFAKTLAVVSVLLIASGLMDGDRFRYLGDKTGSGVCYEAAEKVDRLHKAVDRVWTDVRLAVSEKMDEWAKRTVSGAHPETH